MTKITKRAGTWVEEVYEKNPKGSIQNERSPMKIEMLNGAKPLSNNNSWAEEGQRKSPKINQSNRKALQKPLRTEPYKMLKRTTKPLRSRVLPPKVH